MPKTVDDFKARCLQEWGVERRSWSQGPPHASLIPEFVQFGDASPELRVHLADHLIRESARCRGSFSGFLEETGWYLIAPITFLVPNIRSAGSMPPRPRA